MRKGLLVILVVLMLLQLCGCMDDFESGKPSEQPGTTNAEEYLETQPPNPPTSQPDITEPTDTEQKGENETPDW